MKWTISELTTFAASTAFGLFIGGAISLMINDALIEISLSPFFALVFGLSLLLVGSVIIWRVWTTNKGLVKLEAKIFVALALLVMLSGCFCFVLEKHWFAKLKPHSKVPMYSILGISLSFSLTFSVVDLVNFYSEYCRTGNKPLVGHFSQIVVVLIAAVSMGAIFGSVFGTMDVEDDGIFHNKFKRDQSFCLPLGAIIGGTVGFLNEYIRKKNDPQSLATYDYEI